MTAQRGFLTLAEIPEDASTGWDDAADEFAERFGGGEQYHHAKLILPEILGLVPLTPGARVLDLACGVGHIARALLAHQPELEVVGIDSSARMVELARAGSRNLDGRVRFLCADAVDLRGLEEESFDAVLCNMALMDVRDCAAAISEAARVLKPECPFTFSLVHPCFNAPGSEWIKLDPESEAVGNRIGWKVDNYHMRYVSRVSQATSRPTYYFHRTLEDYVEALREAGFVVSRLREPVPGPELIEEDPRRAEDLKMSGFIVIQAVKWKPGPGVSRQSGTAGR